MHSIHLLSMSCGRILLASIQCFLCPVLPTLVSVSMRAFTGDSMRLDIAGVVNMNSLTACKVVPAHSSHSSNKDVSSPIPFHIPFLGTSLQNPPGQPPRRLRSRQNPTRTIHPRSLQRHSLQRRSLRARRIQRTSPLQHGRVARPIGNVGQRS